MGIYGINGRDRNDQGNMGYIRERLEIMGLKRIYKYELPTLPLFSIALPVGSVFLDLQVQNNAPMLWVLVPYEELGKPSDPPLEYKVRSFATFTTGRAADVDDHGGYPVYVGTYQIDDHGRVFVGHVFCTPE